MGMESLIRERTPVLTWVENLWEVVTENWTLRILTEMVI